MKQEEKMKEIIDKVVGKLAERYKFSKEEGMEYIKEEVVEKRGRPEKKERNIKLKEEKVDELVMEMMKTPPTNKEENKVDKEKKPRAPKKRKEEVKADAPEGEKKEKKPRAPKKKKEEVKADAPVEENKADNKVYVGGFPLKDEFQPKPKLPEPPVEEEEDEEHEEFEHEGKKYYRTPDNVVFDTETLEAIGTWNEKENRIDELEEDEEED